jgi:hypothetical protein
VVLEGLAGESQVHRRRTRLDKDPGDLVGRGDGARLPKLDEGPLAVPSSGDKARVSQRSFGGS